MRVFTNNQSTIFNLPQDRLERARLCAKTDSRMGPAGAAKHPSVGASALHCAEPLPSRTQAGCQERLAASATLQSFRTYSS